MQVVALRTDLRYSMSSLPKRANAGIAFVLFLIIATMNHSFHISLLPPVHFIIHLGAIAQWTEFGSILFYYCPIKVQYSNKV